MKIGWDCKQITENKRQFVIIINPGHNKTSTVRLLFALLTALVAVTITIAVTLSARMCVCACVCLYIFGYPFKLHIMPITKLNLLSCITTAKALSHHTQKNAIARTTHWVRATIVMVIGSKSIHVAIFQAKRNDRTERSRLELRQTYTDWMNKRNRAEPGWAAFCNRATFTSHITTKVSSINC